ncbi:MAG: ClpXP protease specificity-enhancing factor [Wenzhouxiangella sp.]
MLDSRPYLLRAMHEWIVDSGMTPHIIADAAAEGLSVPQTAVQNGKVVLNISPNAVRDLLMDDEAVSFVARFGGVSRAVSVPTSAVDAIYARENGRGMMFSADETDESEAPQGAGSPDDASDDGPKPTRPNLRVVK